jgi:hypothetical protein
MVHIGGGRYFLNWSKFLVVQENVPACAPENYYEVLKIQIYAHFPSHRAMKRNHCQRRLPGIKGTMLRRVTAFNKF